MVTAIDAMIAAMNAVINRGKFITLEGIEGVGKSTALETIVDALDTAGINVVATREPGGTRLGECLRSTLLDPAIGTISADSELLLMFAARAEHITSVIQPALDAGRWVVSDRSHVWVVQPQAEGVGCLLGRL